MLAGAELPDVMSALRLWFQDRSDQRRSLVGAMGVHEIQRAGGGWGCAWEDSRMLPGRLPAPEEDEGEYTIPWVFLSLLVRCRK